jgi:hypothetical protein
LLFHYYIDINLLLLLFFPWFFVLNIAPAIE